MYIGKVVGKVVSTVKNRMLQGMSILLVQPVDNKGFLKDELLVVIDPIGCGEGNIVIVTQGNAARLIEGCENTPLDMAVVGIVDDYILRTK